MVVALDGQQSLQTTSKEWKPLFQLQRLFFFLVLLGLVDADYKFLWIDIGGQGHMSDAQKSNASELKECLEDNSIGFPAPDPLPNDDTPTPYFILGDDAFGLRTFLMKPYAQRQMTKEQRVFNYRLFRGRPIVENGFGILEQRRQILLTTKQHDPTTIAVIVQACVILHNLMRVRYPAVQNKDIDVENANHQVIPGAGNGTYVDYTGGNNRDAQAARTNGSQCHGRTA